MKANPGGTIDPAELIGRDAIINEIWDAINQQSVRINAERRIGKTSIIRKMLAEPRDGWHPIYRDLEKHYTAIEFAKSVYNAVDKFLPKTTQVTRRAKGLFEKLGGTEVSGVLKLPDSAAQNWKELLVSSIQDLADDKNRLLFLWDEVPSMLDNISEREGENVAMEVLDTLRNLRQEHAEIRMVFTGSIGLHHVIKRLKGKGYKNAPVNDMLAIKVETLELDDAIELTSRLIKGEKIQVTSDRTIKLIAEKSDQFPFYIHHIVRALKRHKGKVGPKEVGETIVNQLLDENDPWELRHYRERIPLYYGDNAELTVLAILDSIALRDDVVSVKGLVEELQDLGHTTDREIVIDLLRLTEQDHYFARSKDGLYRFQFPLLQQWWKLSRGL